MTVLKTVMIAAAVVAGATSLAKAQAGGSGGPDGQLTTAAGAADNPPSPKHASGTKHHKQMYMSVKSTRHKTLKTSQQPSKQP
jgi:hypothetical protein